MNEAWQVAELLEDIANNADPVDVLRTTILRVAGNIRKTSSSPTIQFSPDEYAGTLTVTYYIPVDVALKDVKEKPADVLAWLRTGIKPDQMFGLTSENGRPEFTITQIHRGPTIVQDYHELMDKLIATTPRDFKE